MSFVESLIESTLDGIISREDSLRFLSEKLPPNLKLALLRGIRALDEKQREEWLLIRAGGDEFKAHKETLRYWSKYFTGLLRPNSTWADRECVEFGDDIDSEVMEAVLHFMHSGKLMEPRSLSGLSLDELIDEILIATDYLQIDVLISEVGSLRAREEAAGPGIETGPQKSCDMTYELKTR
ncbi:hypothetical protein BDV19DRAFT_261851 [Aspergillus venezuelensis]